MLKEASQPTAACIRNIAVRFFHIPNMLQWGYRRFVNLHPQVLRAREAKRRTPRRLTRYTFVRLRTLSLGVLGEARQQDIHCVVQSLCCALSRKPFARRLFCGALQKVRSAAAATPRDAAQGGRLARRRAPLLICPRASQRPFCAPCMRRKRARAACHWASAVS